MGNRKKKKIIGVDNKKMRKNNKKASSSKHKRRRSQDVKILFNHELKDMKKLRSNDEAFHLSLDKIEEIIDIIHSRKTPTFEIYKRWDKYAISFYLKMCICFGVDYQNLEATPKDDDHDENWKKPLKEQEEHTESSGVKLRFTKPKPMPPHDEAIGFYKPSIFRRRILRGPFKFGSYSPGTEPDRIPYHLYLLVKEAADIMKNTYGQTKLTVVEEKIRFFCRYFHSHLPTGWNYDRGIASSLIAGCDATRKPRYFMAGYTPNRVDEYSVDYDEKNHLSPRVTAMVMNFIYSRKTNTQPSFGEILILPTMISFYCKLCSVFGIDYWCFEATFEDDVCLMNVGRLSRRY